MNLERGNPRFKLGHDKNIEEILKEPRLIEHLDKTLNTLEKDGIQLPERECMGFLLGLVAEHHTLDSVYNILKNKKVITNNKIQFTYKQT